MELLAVFLADEIGMNDRGALRVDGGYLAWLPKYTEPEDGEERTYALAVLGRGLPTGPARFEFEISTPDRPLVFDHTIDLPAEPTWWFSMAVAAKALAGTVGDHRLEVTMTSGDNVRSTVWCEYAVRAR